MNDSVGVYAMGVEKRMVYVSDGELKTALE
jgi:hypothetical protein